MFNPVVLKELFLFFYSQFKIIVPIKCMNMPLKLLGNAAPPFIHTHTSPGLGDPAPSLNHL